MAYFPFEDYVHSTLEEEYQKDLRKKNSIAKYVNALTIDPFDEISLKRLYFVLLFFKNIFTKEATLKFINKKLSDEEKKLVGGMVFDIFVREPDGEIGEEKDFFIEAVAIKKFVTYDNVVDDNWKKLQDEIGNI